MEEPSSYRVYETPIHMRASLAAATFFMHYIVCWPSGNTDAVS